MSKIKKTSESGMPANNRTAKPTMAKQSGGELNPTKVTLTPKKSAVSVVAARTTKGDSAASRPRATDNKSIDAEAATAKLKSTKQEQVLTLLSQVGGVTIDDVMKATGWQQHSVRGFFAGTVRKKLGFEVTSEKSEGGERRYAI
jgi:Protein of unknown function (DUF3489)